VETERREILQFPGIGLGIAVQAETGLVVPVLRNAQKYDTDSLVRPFMNMSARTAREPSHRPI
jgi:pyruvate/2-oxoglutarate dehydrogenase complex dihydrolipoamide acyltransferase (E2) component